MPFLPASHICVRLVAVAVCVMGAGACLGFVLGGWWGSVLGAGVAGLAEQGLLLFYRRRVTASLSAAWAARGESEGMADAVVLGVAFYKAAVFPPGAR